MVLSIQEAKKPIYHCRTHKQQKFKTFENCASLSLNNLINRVAPKNLSQPFQSSITPAQGAARTPVPFPGLRDFQSLGFRVCGLVLEPDRSIHFKCALQLCMFAIIIQSSKPLSSTTNALKPNVPRGAAINRRRGMQGLRRAQCVQIKKFARLGAFRFLSAQVYRLLRVQVLRFKLQAQVSWSRAQILDGVRFGSGDLNRVLSSMFD